MNDLSINNQLIISGKVISSPEFYHEAYDEKFYTFDVEIERLSDNSDVIPVLISEKILDNVNVGDYVTVNGQLRTYNKYESNRRKLLMFAFVRDIEKITADDLSKMKNTNELTIVGFVCKQPTYRVTPLGREVADLLIAVNRAYKKSDYIPAISWGRNARYCEKLPVGTCVQINGRLQSRTYTKKLVDGQSGENRIAYEVSVNRIKIVPVEENMDTE